MLVVTALVVFTPFNRFYIMTVQNLDGLVGQLAVDTMRWLLIFPALWVINSWLRGLLISYKATQAVNGSMVANLMVTVIILGIGLYYQLPGLQTAAIAMVIAALAETLYQAWRLGQMLEIGYDLFRPTGVIKNGEADINIYDFRFLDHNLRRGARILFHHSSFIAHHFLLFPLWP